MNTSCCKDCNKRTYKCHSTCEEYQAFTKERMRILAAKNKNFDIESMLSDSITKSGKGKRK